MLTECRTSASRRQRTGTGAVTDTRLDGVRDGVYGAVVIGQGPGAEQMCTMRALVDVRASARPARALMLIRRSRNQR